jgi:hypothetical protein
MKTTLSIRWDGHTPDLVGHRLSLAAWLEPLSLLLKSVRRTASRILQDALDDPEAGRRGGRYAKAAQQIDLQIMAIHGGCTQPEFLITDGGAETQGGLFPQIPADLPARALDRVLHDIEQEAKGQLANALIRRYLRALPEGVSVHSYDLQQDGVPVKRIEVRDARLPELPPTPAYLSKITGRVTAVSFEPGAVTIKDGSDKRGKITCSANEEQIAAAIALRDKSVVAMYVANGEQSAKPSMIWLYEATALPEVPDKQARNARFLQDWHHTLELLAQ